MMPSNYRTWTKMKFVLFLVERRRSWSGSCICTRRWPYNRDEILFLQVSFVCTFAFHHKTNSLLPRLIWYNWRRLVMASRAIVYTTQRILFTLYGQSLQVFLTRIYKIIWIVHAFWLVYKCVFIALWSTKMTLAIWLPLSPSCENLQFNERNLSIHTRFIYSLSLC